MDEVFKSLASSHIVVGALLTLLTGFIGVKGVKYVKALFALIDLVGCIISAFKKDEKGERKVDDEEMTKIEGKYEGFKNYLGNK